MENIRNIERNKWEYEINGTKHIIFMKEDATEQDVIDALKPPTESQIEEQKAKTLKLRQINEAKQYLADTDWMVTKVSEIKLQEELGYVPEGTTAELAEKYKDISVKRYKARELINNLSK
jgi:hypothetical protein